MSEKIEETGGDGDDIDIVTAKPMPTAEQLDAALKEHFLNKADMDSARGKIGANVKSAETDHNIHRKAFKELASLEKMDDTKRSEYLVHLFSYIGLRGLGPHPDLFDDERAADIAKLASADDALLKQAEEATVN